MLPKSKSKKMALPTLKKMSKAMKRTQPLTVYSDTKGTNEDDQELSLWDIMANVGAMLTNLATGEETGGQGG